MNKFLTIFFVNFILVKVLSSFVLTRIFSAVEIFAQKFCRLVKIDHDKIDSRIVDRLVFSWSLLTSVDQDESRIRRFISFIEMIAVTAEDDA